MNSKTSYLQATSYKLRARPAFTVIEVIIVMAIFSIVLGVVIQIFVFTTRIQRRSRSVQEGYAQARVAVEALVREGQYGTVDYGFYGLPGTPANDVDIGSQPVAVAAFRDSGGQEVQFRCVELPLPTASSPSLCNPSTPQRGQVQVCRGSGCGTGAWAGLTDEATDVVGWSTWVSPDKNPFQRNPDDASHYLSDVQPLVVVVASVRPAAVAGSQPDDVRLQATVSSRTYLR